ncbi:MAG: hypothetical protein C0391_06575 [Anaerolinea sp.]|nr:hypothetical protein [Anaerolinea sp.]
MGYICAAPQQQWTVSNTNGSPVQFGWSLSSGGSGSGTVPANSSLTFSTVGGYHTMTISWLDNNDQQHNLSSTTSETSPCPAPDTATPVVNPPPTKVPETGGGGEEPLLIPVTGGVQPVKQAAAQPTFVSTLTTADPDQELLIPVTGADFSNPFSGTPLGTLFLKFGYIFLGIAFLSQGVSFKLKDN